VALEVALLDALAVLVDEAEKVGVDTPEHNGMPWPEAMRAVEEALVEPLCVVQVGVGVDVAVGGLAQLTHDDGHVSEAFLGKCGHELVVVGTEGVLV
jgi:hypothetical protein